MENNSQQSSFIQEEQSVDGNQLQQQQRVQDNEKQNSQQNFTYYYSSFDLFDEVTEFTFIKYRKFIKNLQRYLGADWRMYANNTVFQMLEDVKNYLSDQQVFEIALQSWLEIRDTFNRKRKISSEDGSLNNSSNIFNGENSNQQFDEIEYFEENEIYESFLKQFKKNLENYQVETTTFKPVAHGFFMSAVETWNDTLKSIKNHRVLSEDNLFELGQQKEQELQQSNMQEKQRSKINKNKNQNKQNNNTNDLENRSLVGKLYNKVQQYGQGNQIVMPLIVASETIMGYLGSKKVKEDPELKNKQRQKIQNSPHELSQASQKNFCSFKNNLMSEEEIVMQKIRKISMQESNLNRKRKQHEMNSSGDEMELDSEEDSQQQLHSVQVENFPQKAERLNEQVFKFASDYISSIKKNTQEKWQVARGFVTNIIELNNNILNKTQQISSEYSNSIKIRFLQPAQQFYNHLMEIWIIFRQQSNQGNDFKLYLAKVKQSMGNKWSETYVLPTQVFFKTLVYTWDQLLQEQRSETDEDTLIKVFVDRVRENMLKNWENDIVNKIKKIKNKNEQHSQHGQHHQQQQQQNNNNNADQEIQQQNQQINTGSLQQQHQQQQEQINNVKIEEEQSEDLQTMESSLNNTNEQLQQQQQKQQEMNQQDEQFINYKLQDIKIEEQSEISENN